MDISIWVNGETTQVSTGTTVAQLIEKLGREPRYLAVERNEELVPRISHRNCILANGDRIEIVTLVGGG